jgi:hypothetical protein
VISVGVLIYRSTAYAEAVRTSLRRHTPELADGRAEFYFVANDATPAVLDWLRASGEAWYQNDNPPVTEEELFARGIGWPEYIHRCYRGWNEVIRRARGDTLVSLSSDMMMSPGWLAALCAADDGHTLPVSMLVEPGHPRCGVYPGAIQCDLGHHPREFHDDVWSVYARGISSRGTRPGGGYQPVLLRRQWIDEAGLYPEGNLAGDSFRAVKEYGDAAYFRRLAEVCGIEHRTVLSSLCYHFKEGEMDE